MTRFTRRTALWAGLALTALGSTIAGAAERAALGPGGPADDQFDVTGPLLEVPLLNGCGKAERFRTLHQRGLLPTAFGSRPPSQALMTPDPTDVLNNNLSIEVNPPSTVITGTNIMTIRSNVDGLTTFGFKLRVSYTVTNVTVTDSIGSYTVVPSGPPANSYARTINFIRPIPLNEVFTVSVSYNGTAPTNVGFGSYFGGTINGASQVSTLSEPYYSATWWPAKDGDVFQPGDNSDKATLDFRITAPSQFKSTANGVLIGTDTPAAGKTRYHYSSSYPISTYLVAFACGTFDTFSTTYTYGPGQSMPVEFFIVPNDNTVANRTAWANCVNMLAAFKDWFGLYPFINEKYGIYQFGFGGGMEHQTNSGQGVTGSTPFGESLTAHELGHQWWGDAVTCKFWNDIWLNEGFATYSEALWLESKGANPAAKAAALKSAMQNRKPGNPTNACWLTDAETANLSRIFDGNSSYNKGSWIVHMLRGIVGDATFLNVLSAYRAAFEGSAASTADFIGVASAAAGQDLSWYFTPWVYGQGAPTYVHSWQTATIEGQLYLRLRIQQTQQASYATFNNPMVARVTTTAGTVDFNVRSFRRYANESNSSSGAVANYFLLPIPGALSGGTPVVLDPDGWVLHYSSTTGSYTQGPPKIVTITPAPASSTTVAAAPTQIRLAFSDSVTTAASDYSVTVTNGSGTSNVPFAFAYDNVAKATTLTLTPPLAAGVYSVAAADTIIIPGQPTLKLDGELASNSSAALPSGDGFQGGATTFTFTVTPNPFCPGDFNQSGGVTVQDLFDFLSAWFADDLSADFNDSGAVTVQDLFDFLSAWFTPCP